MASETHECPRCACRWDTREGAYREELIEWIQHHDRTVADLSAVIDALRAEAFLRRRRDMIRQIEAIQAREAGRQQLEPA